MMHSKSRTLLATAVILLLWDAASANAADESGFRPLITDETLSEWTTEGEPTMSFRLDEGELVGQPTVNEPKNGFLCSPVEFKDFTLRAEFKITPPELNSGIQFRSAVREDGVVAGPQLEHAVTTSFVSGFFARTGLAIYKMFNDLAWSPVDYGSAGIYDEAGDRGWIYPGDMGGDADEFGAQGEKLTRADGWNAITLEADGPNIRTTFNGEPRADFSDPQIDRAGLICLQVHGGEYADPSQYEIRWRALVIRED